MPNLLMVIIEIIDGLLSLMVLKSISLSVRAEHSQLSAPVFTWPLFHLKFSCFIEGATEKAFLVFYAAGVKFSYIPFQNITNLPF